MPLIPAPCPSPGAGAVSHPGAPLSDDRHIPDAFEGKLEPNYFCRAWNPRRSKYCRSRAGAGTDHSGVGRCRLHDGRGKELLKHGRNRRYESMRAPRLQALIAEHAENEEPLDILPELAAARALFQDFVERYDETTAALLAWHESYKSSGRVPLDPEKLEQLRACLDEYEEMRQGGDGLTERQEENLAAAHAIVDRLGQPVDAKPHQVLDLSDAYRIVGEVTKIVERIEKIRGANAISLPELERLLFDMGRVVRHHVTDAAIAHRIEEGWLALRV